MTYTRGGQIWTLITPETCSLLHAILHANEANTLKMKPWTRLDLGVRYSTPMNDHTLVWRANVENVTNEKYWASVDDTGVYVTQGDPRSLKLSVSVDF